MAERYRHYRTRGVYEVVGEGLHTETEEALVVYRDVENGRIWCRPRAMFYGKVETESGMVPRFEKLED
jgi:hypothetical protein